MGKKKPMKKNLSIFLAVILCLYNSGSYLLTDVHAAMEAEAQSIGVDPSLQFSSPQQALYHFVGCGFTGIGDNVDTITSWLSQELQKKTVIHVEEIPTPTLQSQPQKAESKIRKEKTIPILAEIVTDSLKKQENFLSQLKKEDTDELPVISVDSGIKENTDDSPAAILIYAPQSRNIDSDLAALIDGEIVESTPIWEGRKTFLVVGGIASLSLLIFGILGIISSGNGSAELDNFTVILGNGNLPEWDDLDDTQNFLPEGGGSGGEAFASGTPVAGLTGFDGESDGNPAPVPEPSTLLFLSAFLPILFRRKKI